MATDIRVPALGESIAEASVGRWLKKEGDTVAADEPLVELETDKITVEVPAPAAGVLEKVAARTGDSVKVGALLGTVAPVAGASAAPRPASRATPVAPPAAKAASAPRPAAAATVAAPAMRPAAVPARGPTAAVAVPPRAVAAAPASTFPPSVRRLVAAHGPEVAAQAGTGRSGRITKGDVLAVVERGGAPHAVPSEAETYDAELAADAEAEAEAAPVGAEAERSAPTTPEAAEPASALEERVPMSRLRQTIARRLKEAQNTAAMLTTFNEVDMSAVMALRTRYKEGFEKKHGVKLGFMGFFVAATVHALREIPALNAEIDGADIVIKHYYNIGVAVGGAAGLVVPVVRDADRLGLAGVERVIADLGARARAGTLKLDELQGGTFTISNGGVYGSLMSTPILNAPQSGILGMHKIQERAVVVNGAIVARPMMYLALSYDHRIVDGKDAVTFLVRIKEAIEEPERLILEL